ncbi:M48 family metallopeptidase [Hyphomicrobiales bacterium]|nr:M48 family metallopeptidase [Hyphomicrobiales bacterium]
MDIITNDNLSIEVIKSKRRKTISIKISNGSVQIFVPDKFSNFRLEEIIKNRTSWIKKKLEESKLNISKPKEYINGEVFSYLGYDYQLKILQDIKPDVKINDGFLQVSTSKKFNKDSIKKILVKWYKARAIEILVEKTNRYANIIGVQPNTIAVRYYKSRWGQCSNIGNISYNWRILMAPNYIIDYVVVHELCHLIEHNHSKKYWNHVLNNYPDYKACHKWLKINGNNLNI